MDCSGPVGEEKKASPPVGVITDLTSSSCPVCGTKFGELRELLFHMALEERMEKCPICGEPNRGLLLFHLRKRHHLAPDI
jgi:RNA polymerase subunit RPABC4/transcription elongation factor Spt4